MRGRDVSERREIAAFSRAQLDSFWARPWWVSGIPWAVMAVGLTLLDGGDVNIVPGIVVMFVWKFVADWFKGKLRRAIELNEDPANSETEG